MTTSEPMPFLSLSNRRSERPDTAAFRVYVGAKDVMFKLRADLVERLGWEVGQRVDVQLGTDADAGWVRLARDPKGWKLRRLNASLPMATVRLSRRLVDGAPLTESVGAEHRVDGDALVARLPWAAPATSTMSVSFPNPVERITYPHPSPLSEAETEAIMSGGILEDPTHTSPGSTITDEELSTLPAPLIAELSQPVRERFTKLNPAIGRMSEAQAQEFVDACARNALWHRLASIVAEPPGNYARGSIQSLRDRLASRIDAARQKLAPVHVPPFRAPTTTGNKPINPHRFEDVKLVPTDPALKQIHQKAQPVLLAAGYQIGPWDADTRTILIDGAPCTPEEVFRLANASLLEDGLTPIVLDVKEDAL